MPSSWIRKSHFFKSASIRVTGKDLWLLYSDKKLHGQDPEFYNSAAWPCLFSLKSCSRSISGSDPRMELLI